jgi:hypothetical protein
MCGVATSGKLKDLKIKTVTTKEPNAKFHLTEMGATNAPVKDINWHGQDLQTGVRLVDPGEGKPVIVKCFSFSFPPTQIAKVPNKKQLMEYHRKHIVPYLWKDGLELREDIKPLKLLIDKKTNTFKIFATCAFKKGMLVPSRVQDELKPLQQLVSQ